MARNQRPKRPKNGPKTAKELLAEFGAEGGAALITQPKTKQFNVRTTRSTPSRKKRTRAAAPKIRTIELNLEIKPEQSVRGTFEGGDFRTQDSIIIHFMLYDIVSKRLAVQLTGAGKWKWYTYLNVSPQEAAAFENAPSKGQHFNKFIKKHSFRRGKHI